MIYAANPNAEPDTNFAPGELRHLVPGNRGRLLDTRRTPITIVAVTPNTGAFTVEIDAFEDKGAQWELPLTDVHRFQFAHASTTAAPITIETMVEAATRFDQELIIDCDPNTRQETLARIGVARQAIRERLNSYQLEPSRYITARHGDPDLFDLLDHILADRGVADLDHRFATVFVSNPGSGEFIKGHAIVLAELGLCRYRGKIVRDPELFTGADTKPRRAEHIVTRLAFARELWSRHETVTLYRGMATDGPMPARTPSSFVSATLSRDVATEHFDGGPATTTAALWRQDVPITRLFMTFLETREMNQHFAEAEALLIADPANRAF